jgi:predicted nucleic acid-binding protein
MILVDTSVWIHHFRTGSEQLRSLLSEERVFCHPFIAGELACGTLRNRHEILSLLGALPQTRVLEHDEVLHFVDERRLYGRGLGWIDVHLLASALLTGCALWTLDRPLLSAAAALNILE